MPQPQLLPDHTPSLGSLELLDDDIDVLSDEDLISEVGDPASDDRNLQRVDSQLDAHLDVRSYLEDDLDNQPTLIIDLERLRRRG